jgi:hypothetical protein
MRVFTAGLVVGALTATLLIAAPARAQVPVQGGTPTALDALAQRVADLEQQLDALGFVPRVVPLAVRNLSPRGDALGCDLRATEFGDLVLRVFCNTPRAEPVRSTAAFLVTPANPDYTYDGIYVCGVVNNALADRQEFGNPVRFRVSIYFGEVLDDGAGGLVVQRRDSAINSARRGLDFLFEAQALRAIEVDAASAGLRPCVTLPFSQGLTSGDQPRLPGDIWADPDTQVNLFIGLPPMQETDLVAGTGDRFSVSEIGLTVAGRRVP